MAPGPGDLGSWVLALDGVQGDPLELCSVESGCRRESKAVSTLWRHGVGAAHPPVPPSFQVSLNAWFWSTVFHTRDTELTEVSGAP